LLSADNSISNIAAADIAFVQKTYVCSAYCSCILQFTTCQEES